MTGMLMLGKISVGVRSADAVPKIRINTAMTMNVYGRRKASRTIPSMKLLPPETIFLSRLRPIHRAALAQADRFAVPTRNFPIDNYESRVEFVIRKMHSLHPNMRILNYAGVPIA